MREDKCCYEHEPGKCWGELSVVHIDHHSALDLDIKMSCQGHRALVYGGEYLGEQENERMIAADLGVGYRCAILGRND